MNYPKRIKQSRINFNECSQISCGAPTLLPLIAYVVSWYFQMQHTIFIQGESQKVRGTQPQMSLLKIFQIVLNLTSYALSTVIRVTWFLITVSAMI